MEQAAIHSAVLALNATTSIKNPAARQAAQKADLRHLQLTLKAAEVGIKPTEVAIKDEHSKGVARSHTTVRQPGSVVRGRHLHFTTGGRAHVASGFNTSGNWSGYVDSNETYSYVFGDWTVPAANCGPWYDFQFSQSSTWDGIDGWAPTSHSVEQLGTATGCVFGASVYYAWTEMYPTIENPVWEPLSPGDQIMALVYSYDNGTQDELWMDDLTQGWSELRYESTSAVQDSSAEWITERPTCGPFCDELTNFGTTTFNDAYAIGNNTFGTISSFPNTAVDMYNSGYDAEVGGLANSGTTFTDWWEHT